MAETSVHMNIDTKNEQNKSDIHYKCNILIYHELEAWPECNVEPGLILPT